MDFLKTALGVNWCHPGPTITSWDKMGIVHGFTGKTGAPPSVCHVKQVHGVDIVEGGTALLVEADDAPPFCADGVYSCHNDLAVAVKTADCLPLIFHTPRMVMALHAGWRGLAAGIVPRALAKFDEHAIPLQELVVALGPCISLARFEVGPEVIEAFRGAPDGVDAIKFAACIHKGRDDRWHFDLAIYAICQMLERGIAPQQISVIRTCTVEDAHWHSYRREGAGVGRNWSYVKLSAP